MALATESGAASAAAISGGRVVSTSRWTEWRLESASVRIAGEAFHLSVLIPASACFRTSSDGCSGAEGGGIGGGLEFVPGPAVDGPCAASTMPGAPNATRRSDTRKTIYSLLLGNVA